MNSINVMDGKCLVSPENVARKANFLSQGLAFKAQK